MAITFANLTTGGANNPSTTGNTTASITVAAGKLTLITCAVVTNTATTPPSITPTMSGVLFTQIRDNLYDNAGSDRTRIQTWHASPSSDQTGTIDFVLSAAARQIAWVVDEAADDIDTDGTNGAEGIVQSAQAGNSTNTMSRTVTLASFGDATNNAAYGAFSMHRAIAGGTDFVEEAGFTALGEYIQSTTGDSLTVFSEYRVGEDTTVNATTSQSGPIGAIAVELAYQAAAVGGDAPTRKSVSSVIPLFAAPGVTPNATPDQLWRQTAAWGYYGITVTAGQFVTVPKVEFALDPGTNLGAGITLPQVTFELRSEAVLNIGIPVPVVTFTMEPKTVTVGQKVPVPAVTFTLSPEVITAKQLLTGSTFGTYVTVGRREHVAPPDAERIVEKGERRS